MAAGTIKARTYFVVLVAVGHYFLLNVALAVVTDVYHRIRKRLYSYGLYRYGLYSYGLYSCGLYSYGLYSYGL